MIETYVPTLRDRALSAKAADTAAIEAHGAHERRHWVAVQRERFCTALGRLGHIALPEQVQLVEVGDGVHQELTLEVEGVQFRMEVDYRVHLCLTATLVCSFCGLGAVNRRVDSLEDLGAAYERLAEHEADCMNPEHEQRGLGLGCSSPEEYAELEAEQ